MVPKEMPTELLVIGSGAIGIEFASFYNDLGAKVTVVEMLDRIVPVEDKDISEALAKSLTEAGHQHPDRGRGRKPEAGRARHSRDDQDQGR
jgi:pyruvate/2-oxoglutarate dehydrogenase complex dihydrolipoamide dehydrogenase (E3) component